MATGQVPPVKARTKDDVSDALSDGWHRVTRRLGRGAFADAIGVRCPKTVGRAIAGEHVPELHTALNSLVADPTALDEVFALYGGRFVPAALDPANDLHVIAGLNHVSSEWLQRLLDGIRCHRDTAALAELFRPLVASMTAVIEEADSRRGAA